MRRHRVRLAWGLALAGGAALLWVPRLAAQTTLSEAASRVRQQWLAHNLAGLFREGDTVRLQVPGVAQSAALGAAQAARLLGYYLEATRETSFDLAAVRPAGTDRGYAEGRRRYVVQGTAEEREETVFLGFELQQGRWRLQEVRIVP